MDYVIVDIETCPINLEGYLELGEEDRKKLINPIDSKIVAIGMKYGNMARIIQQDDEKAMLEEFWLELKTFRKGDPSKKIVGFNIKDFDLPFLVTRSFLHNVEIMPFRLSEVVDLREKLSAFKWGHVRGRLKEYGKALDIELHEMDGSKVAEACVKGEIHRIKDYLLKDLEITDKMTRQIIKTKIIHIERY